MEHGLPRLEVGREVPSSLPTHKQVVPASIWMYRGSPPWIIELHASAPLGDIVPSSSYIPDTLHGPGLLHTLTSHFSSSKVLSYLRAPTQQCLACQGTVPASMDGCEYTP
jgi:hypothetical protein